MSCLAACRRERSNDQGSRPSARWSLPARVEATQWSMVADRKRSMIVSERAASMSLHLRYTPDKVWKRLRLKAKQTRHHSHAAASSPRKENWRKPSTSLMMPITGSTVHVRAL